MVYWVSSSMTRIKAWKAVVELYILWSGGCPGFVSVQVLHRFSKQGHYLTLEKALDFLG